MKKVIALLMAVLMTATIFAGCTSNTPSGGNSANGDSTDSGASDSSWSEVEAKGELVVGFDAGFPPMGYLDSETGEYIGFDLDVAAEVCSRLGIAMKKQPIAWDAKEQELNSKNIDCIWNGMSWTQQREDELLLSKPYMRNDQVLLAMAGSEFTTVDALVDQEIGVQAKSSAETALNDDKNKEFKDSLKNVVGIESYTIGVAELEQGSIKAIAIDAIVARHYIAKNPSAYVLVNDSNGEAVVLEKEDFVIGFRKSDVSLEAKIYETLKEMKADGKLAEISNTWFNEDITTIE